MPTNGGSGGGPSIPFVSFDQSSYSVNENGSAISITVELSSPSTNDVTVNYQVIGGTATEGTDYTYDPSPVTITAGNTQASFTFTPIDDSDYEGDETAIFKITSAVNANVGSPDEATVTIADDDGYFTFRIDTTKISGTTFKFQADNAVDLFIDWGDGNTTTYSGTGLISYTYSTDGIYDISLQGQATRIAFWTGLGGTEDALVDILTPVSDGITGLTSAINMFRDTANFGTSPLTAPDFFDEASKNVTNMRAMFYRSSFNQPIGNWDVFSVTDMSWMFAASSFNQPIGNWDVSSVTDMSYMFYKASPFNQPIGNWDVSSVTNMDTMFRESSFNQDISNWDVSNVTNMRVMFYHSSFNQPLADWGNRVANVTDMSYMFYEASSFNQPIGNWNVSSVTDMSAMFAWSSFNQDISNWDVSNVTNMNGMLDYTPMSRDNYDNLLIGWNSLPSLQPNVNFGVAGLEYCNGETARANIISTYNWTFNGDTKNCP